MLVPVSAGLYLLAGGIAVFSFYDQIPEVLGKIVGGAFGLADNAGQTDGSSILNFSGISGRDDRVRNGSGDPERGIARCVFQ